eukprot:m.281725 g.281725  ORF g.281725 m.281725 type:complete len:318 (+) comp11107_c0_seq52:2216-3169(+)
MQAIHDQPNEMRLQTALLPPSELQKQQAAVPAAVSISAVETSADKGGRYVPVQETGASVAIHDLLLLPADAPLHDARSLDPQTGLPRERTAQRGSVRVSQFDVFVSYRVAANVSLANALFEAVERESVSSRLGRRAQCYLDSKCLQAGRPWQEGFVRGLQRSAVFAPVVSAGALAAMAGLGQSSPGDKCDNVLLEMLVALILEALPNSRLKMVCPLLVGSVGADGRYEALDIGQVLAGLPDTPSPATLEQLRSLGERLRFDVPARLETLSVRGVVSEVLKFQGFKLSDCTSSDKAAAEVAQRMCNEVVATYRTLAVS